MKRITQQLLSNLSLQAASTSRLRTHLTLHEVPTDPVQRLFVAAEIGTYFRPHCHADKAELTLAVRGSFDLLLFDDSGLVTERCSVGHSTAMLGFELPARVWHTYVITSPGTIFFEVKRGPYDVNTAAEFATWAPPEGTAETASFLQRLSSLQIGEPAAQTDLGSLDNSLLSTHFKPTADR